MENSGTALYKKILTALLCLLLAVYVLYHISLNFKKPVSLFAAQKTTVTETVALTGYLFREGTALYSYAGGTVYYPYESGEKVGAGKVIAYIYRSASPALIAQIEDLEKQIDILRQGSRIGGTDGEQLQKEIDALSDEISRMNVLGNTAAAEKLGHELLVLMAKKELLSSGRTDYTAEIYSLEMQKQSLVSALGSPSETVISSESGYFYQETDGLEALFSHAEAEELSLERFQTLTSATATSQANAVGILLTDFRWYYAAKVKNADAEGFAIGETHEASFPDNAHTQTLPMTVYSKETVGEETLIVFSCDTLPQGFSMQRCQRMEIVRQEYTGFRVPSDEVRVIEGATFVYIFKEGVATLREVDIIMEQNGYYLVSADYVSPAGNAVLAENELIIVEEDGLYQGKIVG